MKSFWEESPEDKVERLTEEVETLRFEQERHAEELKEKMESQFHQQQYEARMCAETEREERQREESFREEMEHRDRLTTSQKSLVKRILEAAVCAKRGTELSSEDVAEKAMDNFLNFIAKLMSDKVYLIAEFPEYVKTMSADDYADYKIRPRAVDDDDDDDEEQEDDGPLNDPVRNYLKGFHKQWDQAQRNFARRRLDGYESLDGKRIEEASRVIDFATAVPALRDSLKKLGAPARLQEKAEKLAEIMKTVSDTLREHAEAALSKAKAEAEQARVSRKRRASESKEFMARLRPLQEQAKKAPDGSKGIIAGFFVGFLGSLYFTWGWDHAGAKLVVAVIAGIVACIVLMIPFLFIEELIDKFVRAKDCEVCGSSRQLEKMSYCEGCFKVMCNEGHSDCCPEPSHWPLKRDS